MSTTKRELAGRLVRAAEQVLATPPGEAWDYKKHKQEELLRDVSRAQGHLAEAITLIQAGKMAQALKVLKWTEKASAKAIEDIISGHLDDS